jgi:hypothetical protein
MEGSFCVVFARPPTLKSNHFLRRTARMSHEGQRAKGDPTLAVSGAGPVTSDIQTERTTGVHSTAVGCEHLEQDKKRINIPSSRPLTTTPSHAISLTGLGTASREARIVTTASKKAEENTKNKSGVPKSETQSGRFTLLQSTKKPTPARGARKLCQAAIRCRLVLLIISKQSPPNTRAEARRGAGARYANRVPSQRRLQHDGSTACHVWLISSSKPFGMSLPGTAVLGVCALTRLLMCTRRLKR